MGKESVIRCEKLEKVYGSGGSSFRVLKEISLDIKKGDLTSIIGPSGAGKSTLLNLIGCLDTFNSGSLNVMGMDTSSLSVEALSGFRNRHIGFIFQQHNLLPEFTALENIMMPLLIRRMKKKKAKEFAESILERFNLTNRAEHHPTELSGGECQRIAVARAIVGNPDIILADEPTGSLDSANSKKLTEILFELGNENDTTILMVTHDLEIASLAERTISLKDGKIV